MIARRIGARRVMRGLAYGVAACLLVWSAAGLRADPAPDAASAAKTQKKKERPLEPRHRVSLAVARDRAEQLKTVFESTLHVMHRHYFHGDRATVPARAMEEVFGDVARASRVDAKWISVNTKPMSVEHEPENEFEKRAAKEIAAGKPGYELVDGGWLRSASSIELGGGCLRCHANSFAPPAATPRYAALVINIPLVEETPVP